MNTTVKASCKKVGLIIATAFLFGFGIYHVMGQQAAMEFFGAYFIEFSLSIDNLFVFITIFAAFQIPVAYQHRVLAWGIGSAVVLRFIFIFLGVTVVEHFSWILSLFGAVLIFSGLKMFKNKHNQQNAANHPALKLLKKCMPVTDDFAGHHFLTKINNRWHATPLLAALIVIECSDVLFAIDSVPAAFSVSTNMFLIYTSNILAILGLRQLYFVLEHLQERFQYVRFGVAIILSFTGVKLLALMFDVHISIPVSIGFIAAVLLLSILFSMTAVKQKMVPQTRNLVTISNAKRNKSS